MRGEPNARQRRRLSQRLPRLVGANRAREVSFTGEPLKAERAQEWGLVNRVVPHDSLLQEAEKLAHRISSFRPEMVAGFKRVLTEVCELKSTRLSPEVVGFEHMTL
jgi:enoyl-CoA hydratase/carnithine racemase